MRGGSFGSTGNDIYYSTLMTGYTDLSTARMDWTDTSFNFQVMDLRVDGSTDTGGACPTRRVGDTLATEEPNEANCNEFLLSISSSVAKEAGALVLYVEGENTSDWGDKQPIPIYSVNGTPCSSTNCWDCRSNGHCYAAKYTASGSYTIGFYPSQVCTDYPVTAGSVSKTANGWCQDPPTDDPTLSFIATIKTVLAGKDAPTSDSKELDTARSFTMHFQTAKQTFGCPAPAPIPNIFFPGDGEIQLSTSAFSLGGATALANAPLNKVLIVGEKGSAVDLTTAFTSSDTNDLAIRGDLNSTIIVSPLDNTVADGDANKYYFSFLLRDASGLLIAPATGGVDDPAACHLEEVRSANIQGFLTSSNCFIATAVHGSQEAAPVVLLRAFRDQILLKTTLGEGFVHWYYSWSPNAAAWLRDHPLWRVGVLFFLVPIEVLAWLMLHPWMSLLGVCTVSSAWWVRRRWMRAREASSAC